MARLLGATAAGAILALCRSEAVAAALQAGAADAVPAPFSALELRSRAALALERARASAERERLAATVRALEACRALAPCLEPGEVYPVALDLVLGAVGASRGFALFRRLSAPQGDGIAFRGFREAEARALRVELVECKRVDLALFQDVRASRQGPALEALRAAGADARSLVAVPVRGAEREEGVIWIADDAVELGAAELRLVETIRQHAEAALRNAERYANAKERAFVDDVTEVYNARYLMSAADNEIRRAERYGNSLSVVFLDLDRFKLVNDSHGHLVGSQTLRNLSKLLLGEIRQVDTLARYGGDEFTILLADTSHEAALIVAERIRRRVEEHLFECPGAAPLRLTISAGVASFPEHGRSRVELLEAADKAMYRAKSLGRNRTCSAHELAGAEAVEGAARSV
ncbi:MAG: GGDEF domain-containing protein [Myxococcota bacterium]